jgi:flagellin
MVIANNILSQFTANTLKINDRNNKRTTECLSTGYRINRAADDAAGLTISMKMRTQIRGLDQASENMEAGVSMVKVADGAMGEMQAILTRMSELSVKAANDTNQSIDRSSIQDEIDSLRTELISITNDTEYNDIKVLQGNSVTPIYGVTGGMPPWTKSGIANTTPLGGLTDTFVVDNAGTPENHSAAYIDFTNLNPGNVTDLLGNGFHTTCCTCNNRYSIEFVNTGNNVISSGNNYTYQVDITGVIDSDGLLNRIMSALDGSGTFQDQYGNTINTVRPQNHYTDFTPELDSTGTRTGRLLIFDNRPGQLPNIGADEGVFREGIYGVVGQSGSPDFHIQTGPNAGDAIAFELANTQLSAIGLSGNLSVMSYSEANTTLNLVNNAKDYVSSERGRFGAIQNRFEHALGNSNNMSENTQDAESRISDADMATEMVKYSKQKILSKAGESMLAQTNAIPEGILKLLQ